jgi:glutamine synthetase
MGAPANGCHHNCSVWLGGEGSVERLVPGELPGMDEVFTYSKGGTNEFEGTGEGRDGWLPTKLGHQVLGGSIRHIGGRRFDQAGAGRREEHAM